MSKVNNYQYKHLKYIIILKIQEVDWITHHRDRLSFLKDLGMTKALHVDRDIQLIYYYICNKINHMAKDYKLKKLLPNIKKPTTRIIKLDNNSSNLK